MLLSVENLSTFFRTRGEPVRAVDGVSFEVEAGQTVCLVGESGSGKSVTSLSLIQLLPPLTAYHPTGRIVFTPQPGRRVAAPGGGSPVDMLRLSEGDRRRVRGARISMIFQEPMTSLNPVLTIGEQLVEPLIDHMAMRPSAALKRATELLELVHIPSPDQRIREYPHQLSGGMRQRVMIAMAMACEPDLLIADEPTTALDVTIQAQILSLMKELQTSRGTAILFITHDLAVVNQIADRICVMKLGKIVETGDRQQVLYAPEHAYTRQLLDALPANLKRERDAAFVAEGRPRPGSVEAREAREARGEGSIVELEGLKVHFPIRKGILKRTVGQVKAVDDVTLSIRRGQVLALVGESGSGKTTLGRAVLRLIDPTGGVIRFDGKEIQALSQRELRPRRRQMQIVFQDPYSSLNPRMTIGDTLVEGMAVQKIGENKAARTERARDMLRQVQLNPDMLDRYPHEFSGGQRQRIGIARCLVLNPQFIVCDEVTSALDVSVQAQILELLLELREKFGLTYLFITHDLGVVEYVADEVAVMYQGKIVERGVTEQVVHEPEHAYTRTLLSAVPRIESPRNRAVSPTG